MIELPKEPDNLLDAMKAQGNTVRVMTYAATCVNNVLWALDNLGLEKTIEELRKGELAEFKDSVNENTFMGMMDGARAVKEYLEMGGK